jgi:predicted ferric reductase
MNPSGSLSASTRIILGSLIVLLALLVLVGGWTIPYTFESFSILYKFGIEKIYLRSGKVIGITIVLLVFYQTVLAARFSILEQIFSAGRLLTMHRSNGMLIACLVCLHPLLIKASENFTPYTFEKKYYPEFLGIGLFVIIVSFSATAVFRRLLKMPYPAWLLLHRLGATLTIVILPAHVLWVSETFKSGLPRSAALVMCTLAFLLILRIWLQRLSTKMK